MQRVYSEKIDYKYVLEKQKEFNKHFLKLSNEVESEELYKKWIIKEIQEYREEREVEKDKELIDIFLLVNNLVLLKGSTKEISVIKELIETYVDRDNPISYEEFKKLEENCLTDLEFLISTEKHCNQRIMSTLLNLKWLRGIELKRFYNMWQDKLNINIDRLKWVEKYGNK